MDLIRMFEQKWKSCYRPDHNVMDKKEDKDDGDIINVNEKIA